MEIGAFLNTLWGKVSAGAISIITLGIVSKFRDEIIFRIIKMINISKYKDMVLNGFKKSADKLISKVDLLCNKIPQSIEKLDVKYIDPLKAKNPKAGALLEKELAAALRDSGKEIEIKFKILGSEIKKDFDTAANNILDI